MKEDVFEEVKVGKDGGGRGSCHLVGVERAVKASVDGSRLKSGSMGGTRVR